MKLEAKARLLQAELDDTNVGNRLLRALKRLDKNPVMKSRSLVRKGISYTFFCENNHTRQEYIKAVAGLDSTSSTNATSVSFTVNTEFGVVYEETFLVLSSGEEDSGGRVVTIVLVKK